MQVSYHTSALDSFVDAGPGSVTYSKRAVKFSAPLNSRAMAIAASSREFGGPQNDTQNADASALSYASLAPSDGGEQTIVVNASLS